MPLTNHIAWSLYLYIEFDGPSANGSTSCGFRAAVVQGDASSSQSQPMSCD